MLEVTQLNWQVAQLIARCIQLYQLCQLIDLLREAKIKRRVKNSVSDKGMAFMHAYFLWQADKPVVADEKNLKWQLAEVCRQHTQLVPTRTNKGNS